MRQFAVPFALTLLGAALALPFAAIADDPLAPYEGRPLPGLLKKLIWEKACDIPQAEAEGDTCQGNVCRFERSNGTAYKPQVAAWMDLTMFQWAAYQNALQPALVQGKIATESELDGDARLAVALASGLAVDIKSDDNLVQMNPLLVRWAIRELLPPAAQPMCGKTAKEFFQASFAGPTRLMVDVYAQLKTRGALRSVNVVELDQNFSARKGRYMTLCESIGKKTKVEDESYPRTASCWWWLRRAASGGTDELALLLGRTLRDYDPDAYKSYASTLPKELRTK